MVKNSRKKTISGRIRPLNSPLMISVQVDTNGCPAVLKLRGKAISISAIFDMWDVVDEWWKPGQIVRRYYGIELENGGRMMIFHDNYNKAWYRQQISPH